MVDEDKDSDSEEGEHIDIEMNANEDGEEEEMDHNEPMEGLERDVSNNGVLPVLRLPSAVKKNRKSRAQFLSDLTTSIEFISIVAHYESIKVTFQLCEYLLFTNSKFLRSLSWWTRRLATFHLWSG